MRKEQRKFRNSGCIFGFLLFLTSSLLLFFLLIGHFFCKMIGVEPRSVSNEIALFTLTGGAASLFILIKSKQWKKYKNEIMPPLILTILLIFVFVAIFRAH